MQAIQPYTPKTTPASPYDTVLQDWRIAYQTAGTPAERSAALSGSTQAEYDIKQGKVPVSFDQSQQKLQQAQSQMMIGAADAPPLPQPSQRAFQAQFPESTYQMAKNQSLNDLGQVYGEAYQNLLNDNSAQNLVNAKNTALRDSLLSQNQAVQQRDWLANQLRSAKNTQESRLSQDLATEVDRRTKLYNDDLKAMRDTYTINGIGAGDFRASQEGKLRDSYEQGVADVQKSHTRNVQDINTQFTSNMYNIAQQAQNQLLQAEQVLNNRLDTISNEKMMTEKAKREAENQLKMAFVQEKRNVLNDYFSRLESEQQAAQKALETEMQIAGLTGIFQGEPTLSAQRLLQDALESDRNYQLNVDKFSYQQQQDAIENALKRAKAAAGDGSGVTASEAQQANMVFANLTAQGVDSNVALEQAVKSVQTGKYGTNQAQLRASILSGPAKYTVNSLAEGVAGLCNPGLLQILRHLGVQL